MRVACLAQLVNVIAPLVTNAQGVLRQSIFHPYAWALQYARGRVVDLRVESDVYPIKAEGLRADFARNDQVPFVDVAVTVDAATAQACVLMLNRDLDAERELVLEWQAPTPTRVLACETLTGPDLKAFNTFAQPDAGRRRGGSTRRPPGARMTFKLPPRSYTVAHLATGLSGGVVATRGAGRAQDDRGRRARTSRDVRAVRAVARAPRRGVPAG